MHFQQLGLNSLVCDVLKESHPPPAQYITGENLNIPAWNLFFQPQQEKCTPEIIRAAAKSWAKLHQFSRENELQSCVLSFYTCLELDTNYSLETNTDNEDVSPDHSVVFNPGSGSGCATEVSVF